MSNPSGTYSDGTVQFGTQVLQIPSSTGSNYIANNIRITQGASVIESTDQFGRPAREVMIGKAFAGSAQLQLASNVTNWPNIGDAFTVTGPGNIGTLNCKVAQIEFAEEKEGETFYNIEIRQKLN